MKSQVRFEPVTDLVLTPTQVRHIRVLSGYSKIRLAEKLGVTRGTIWRWESGLTPCSGDSAYKLAAIAAQKGVRWHDESED